MHDNDSYDVIDAGNEIARRGDGLDRSGKGNRPAEPKREIAARSGARQPFSQTGNPRGLLEVELQQTE